MSASCIYEGTIRHRRLDRGQEFSHRLALTYLDLEELPSLLGGRLTSRRPGLVRFRRRDYLGHRGVPLDSAVRDLVEGRTATRPTGPIRLLTHLRSFGHCFNPVSFYYCFAPGGEHVQALVAEVTNTPWRERHAYVVDHRQGNGNGVLGGEFDKALHVSPFMRMDHRYEVHAAPPAETLSVHIASRRMEATVFDATLALRRRELTRASMAAITAQYPFATIRVLMLIYGHAVALKLAGAPVHPHPRVEAAPER